MKEYFRCFAQEKGEPFVIEMSGKSWCDGSYLINRKNAKIWVVEYILSGRGTVRDMSEPGREYHPEADDVYLLEAGKDHYYFSDSEEPWEKIFVNFSGPVVEGLADAYGLSGRILYPSMTELKPEFLKVYELMTDEELSERYVLEQVEMIIHKIFRTLGQQRREAQQESGEMQTVRRYLDEHVGQIVGIQELSELIYRSPDYLIKHFKKEIGMTPYQYLLKRKMTIAERLLRDTVLPIKEVAEHVGYEDAHYFSGLFKKEKGIAPRQFRKNLHQE